MNLNTGNRQINSASLTGHSVLIATEPDSDESAGVIFLMEEDTPPIRR